jgi:hypothetical protein
MELSNLHDEEFKIFALEYNTSNTEPNNELDNFVNTLQQHNEDFDPGINYMFLNNLDPTFYAIQMQNPDVLVDLSSRRQHERALSALNYGLTPYCNLSQSHHGRMPIVCAHTTGNMNTYLSQVSYINILRSQYKQGCNQCEHSYTQVYQNLNAHQLHINAPYKHLSASIST